MSIPCQGLYNHSNQINNSKSIMNITQYNNQYKTFAVQNNNAIFQWKTI